jgi:hypothetical protein
MNVAKQISLVFKHKMCKNEAIPYKIKFVNQI